LTAECAENREGRGVDENNIGEMVLGRGIKAPLALGPGLLENACEACLAHEFAKAGLSYQRQIGLPVVYDGQKIDFGYRLDLLVEIHRSQCLSDLKLGGYRLGYPLNFNAPRM
jgi:hypothetical protein